MSGRIIFTDKLEGEEGYMLQEFLVGRLEEHKVKLVPKSLILFIPNTRSSTSWIVGLGILVDADTIVGVSNVGQGIEGKFTFTERKELNVKK